MNNLEMGGQVPTPENKSEQGERIQITKEEIDKYILEQPSEEELKAWMEEKGIDFDQGLIKVSVDGVNHLMNTDKEDFGTLSGPDDEVGGLEKLDRQ